MVGTIIILLTLVLVVLGWRYASSRQGAAAVTGKPKRLLSFTTDLPPLDALLILSEKANGAGYSIDDVDKEGGRLILSTPPTATTWGFFYPIYFATQGDGRTLVEVGIQSKLFQMGPMVRKSHERCLGFAKETLSS